MCKLAAVITLFFSSLFIFTNANASLIDLNNNDDDYKNINLLISYGGGGGGRRWRKFTKSQSEEES